MKILQNNRGEVTNSITKTNTLHMTFTFNCIRGQSLKKFGWIDQVAFKSLN